MPYVPHTDEDRRQMLETIGVGSIEDLFCEIPDDLRLKPGQLNIPSALDESKLFLKLVGLARQNLDATRMDWYLGAGLYDRYVPAIVGQIINRGEFLTAYTPYQPEVSQGYLQCIYEFQSMIAELMGMQVANASMYDGATSLAEACLMACAHTNRRKVVISDGVHHNWIEVVKTYMWATEDVVDVIPTEDCLTKDFSKVDAETAAVVVQYPNFYGSIEDLNAVREAARAVGALFIVAADPLAMALLTPPGAYDADVVVGEGQSLGVAMGFGGPLVGLYSCKEEFIRRLPGRIVGRTQDKQGRSGFVMTLRTREQDIRRERATSNICTNEALMALCNTIYMTALGKNGVRSVAESTVRNTQYAIKVLTAAGAKLVNKGPVFGEFVLDLGKDATEVQTKLLDKQIMAGLPLGGNQLLVAVTESRTKEQIDRFAAELKEVLK